MALFMNTKRFIPPPLISNKQKYSHYNYLQKGFVSEIKKLHFEIALTLTSNGFKRLNVIDFGCADGIFLPSLSKYFNTVVGIDFNPNFIDMANRVKLKAGLFNTRCLCNVGMSWDDLKTSLKGKTYHLAFLLEVPEHVGEHGLKQHNSRAHFLEQIFTLLHPKGVVIASVPIMNGISFILQKLALTIFNMNREPYRPIDFLIAAFKKDTKRLESQYTGGHKGFIHESFERSIQQHFYVQTKISTLFQMVYVIKYR